jgi:formate hydrogenlyase transcriptional activator
MTMYERVTNFAGNQVARRWPQSVASLDRHELTRALHLAVDHLPHALLILDESGEILTANHAADRIFGHGQGHLVGKRITQLIPELAPALIGQSWSAFCAEGQAHTIGSGRPLEGIRGDGTVVPIELELKWTADRSVRPTVAFITDVTERVMHEARAQVQADAQLRLHRLVADLATRFVTVETDAIDGAIVEALQKIAEALGLDQAVLWQRSGDFQDADSYHWNRDGSPESPALEMSSLLFIASKLAAGETACFTRVEDVPEAVDRDELRRQGLRSVAVIPVESGGGAPRGRGALALSARAIEQEWDPTLVEQLRIVAGILGQALRRKADQQGFANVAEEIARRRERRSEPATANRSALGRISRLIVSEGPALKPALAQVEQVAPTPATVLLLGETGVGKEVFAQAIHELSPRHQRPMIRVSCAAIPSALIESELFGRERGAYTGALTRQIGRFEVANHSTLFLDEIGELPPEVQVKLLRVLQDRVIERLGSTQSLKVDVRIIAATNRNLLQAVESKAFREDLFYRLNVFPIVVPPLRDRIEDIPALAWEFVDEFSKSFGKPIESISKDSMKQLQQYRWPGNVRELRNVIERAVILATGPCLTVPLPEPAAVRQTPSTLTLRNLELDHIRATLENTNWRVRGHGGAAERLGLKPTTLEGRMAKLGLTRPRSA